MTPEELVNAIVQQSDNMTRPVYRGQANSDWQPESGAVRRLRQAYGTDFPEDENQVRRLVAEYHNEQLIMPMQVIDGARRSDLQRLSILQHQGAATGLLDFTELPLTALWFACMELPEKDGKIFVLDIGNPQIARNARSLEHPLDAGQTVVYYEPDRALGARIVAQQSIFVVCNSLLPDRNIRAMEVPRSSKRPLQDYLRRLGLSQTTLFGDIPGLATANSTRTPLQRTLPLTPEQHRDRGNRAHQAGRYGDALAEYRAFAAALPDTAQPHCLIGDVLAALGRFEDADRAYTRAIENLDRPIYLGNQVTVNQELGNEMASALYYNRGNVRAARGNHSAAVADFDAALQHPNGPKREALLNRGNSKFAMERFAEAHQDFADAWLEREGSDTVLAMGNCKVMTGEFEESQQRYLKGSSMSPERSAASCRQNAEQVRRALVLLDGHGYEVRRDGFMVSIETAHVQAKQPLLPFVGNQGNTGNIPSGLTTAYGGKGYGGTTGFVVAIVPAVTPPS